MCACIVRDISAILADHHLVFLCDCVPYSLSLCMCLYFFCKSMCYCRICFLFVVLDVLHHRTHHEDPPAAPPQRVHAAQEDCQQCHECFILPQVFSHRCSHFLPNPWAGDIRAPGEGRLTLCACAVRVSSPCVCTLEHICISLLTFSLSHTHTHTHKHTHM